MGGTLIVIVQGCGLDLLITSLRKKENMFTQDTLLVLGLKEPPLGKPLVSCVLLEYEGYSVKFTI